MCSIAPSEKRFSHWCWRSHARSPCLPVAFTDEADIQATDAVNMLTALGVIEGDPDGSFRPDATVTRAEMAKMIFVVRNNSIDDSAYANNL